jgi:hypothetical protein
MRFEVNVDDGAGLNALNRAREAWNTANPDAQAPDMPSFVQRLTDQAVAGALQALGEPATLQAALDKIATLEKKALEANTVNQVAAAKP